MACVFGELNDIVASFFSSTIEDLSRLVRDFFSTLLVYADR
jgi:hypothetical protein